MFPIRIAVVSVVALLPVLAACGEGSEAPGPADLQETPFARALAELGGGGEGSVGVGWVEPALAKERGLGAEVMADALAPNAGTFVERARVLRRRYGVDPLAADRLLSIGGSYAFGIRMDGIGGGDLVRTLAGEDGRVSRSGGVELVNLGAYAVVPQPLLELGIRGLGARDAFAEDLVVLAISARARAALLGRGERLIDEPVHRAAAECLGDVAAVRTIPDKLVISADMGVDQLAMGMRSRREEVLCVVGGTAERAAEVKETLDSGLAADAAEPRSGEPMGDLLRGREVSAGESGGVPFVRAEVTTPPTRPPGFFFGTVARGSLFGLVIGT